MADTGLIVTVVIFCLIFAWIITFSILAMALKKPIFAKLSLIGPLGYKVYTSGMHYDSETLKSVEQSAKANRINARLMKEQEKLRHLENSEASESPKTEGGYYYNDDIDPDF